jgi:uncharacterized Zn finger protein (UPF0148 family)
MSKVIAKQIDHILKGDKFIRHKKNAKGNTAIYSRNHPTAKFVRVVVDSGIDLTSGKANNQVGVKLVYIHRAKSWREITIEIFATAKKLASAIKQAEVAEKFVKSCKFCKAKKFKAKTGNTVCANACWTAWAGKKKSEKTTKKSSQKIAAQKTKAARQKNLQRKPQKKSSQKVATQPYKKSSQKKGKRNLQRFSQKILPGDLVTIEEFVQGEVITDYTGRVLGIVQKVEGRSVTTAWTANTGLVPEWLLPVTNEYEADALKSYRFKVLSRKCEWVKVA